MRSVPGTSGTGVLRVAIFQAVSILTTTGYVTANFENWPGLAQFHCDLLAVRVNDLCLDFAEILEVPLVSFRIHGDLEHSRGINLRASDQSGVSDVGERPLRGD